VPPASPSALASSWSAWRDDRREGVRPQTGETMTQALKDTRYWKELATARLPSGSSKKSAVAIERIFAKRAKQVEIRFSQWQGTKMMPKPLALTEEKFLPLLSAAIRTGVFSEEFVVALQRVLGELMPSSPEDLAADAPELARVQAHFHALIRSRAGDALRDPGIALPTLVADAGSQDDPIWFAIDGMQGGFKYWWDSSAKRLRLMAESWSRTIAGSGQLHEVTATGARLLGEGFV
jgi:hypothetical protein